MIRFLPEAIIIATSPVSSLASLVCLLASFPSVTRHPHPLHAHG